MNFNENVFCLCLFQLTGSETVWEAFEQQVANYQFQTSLFDTVVSYYSSCLKVVKGIYIPCIQSNIIIHVD